MPAPRSNLRNAWSASCTATTPSAFRALIRAELEDDDDIEIVGEAPDVDGAVRVAG